MSKTISFVATDELAEYLEREAEKRMTTISSTAQILLAEKASEVVDTSEPDDEEAEPAKPALGVAENPTLKKHSDKWYEPDGEHDYAVYLADGSRKYYKTPSGAANRLKDEYE